MLFSKSISTVAQVMSDFNQRVQELRAVANDQDAEAARQSQIMEDARAAMNAATDEAAHARATADRLEEAYKAPSILSVSDLRAEIDLAHTV